jgi:protein-tyrosine phosphatase
MENAGERGEFEIVVICSGNRFRSPISEAVLRDATSGLPVHVSSAGTLDLRSGPAFVEAVEIARSYGLDLSAHCSRRLRDADIAGADLVLGFEPIHVAAAVAEAGARRERAFLLTELAEYAATLAPPRAVDPRERARLGIEAAHEARLAAGSPHAPEVSDPVGGSPAEFLRTGERVRALTLSVTEFLFGPR